MGRWEFGVGQYYSSLSPGEGGTDLQPPQARAHSGGFATVARTHWSSLEVGWWISGRQAGLRLTPAT